MRRVTIDLPIRKPCGTTLVMSFRLILEGRGASISAMRVTPWTTMVGRVFRVGPWCLLQKLFAGGSQVPSERHSSIFVQCGLHMVCRPHDALSSSLRILLSYMPFQIVLGRHVLTCMVSKSSSTSVDVSPFISGAAGNPWCWAIPASIDVSLLCAIACLFCCALDFGKRKP